MAFFLRCFLVFLGGFLGAALFIALLPSLHTHWPLKNVPAFAEFGNGNTVIERTEQVVVEETTAFQDAVAAQRNGIVALRAVGARGNDLAYASGIVLTNDGLIAVPFSVVRRDAKQYLIRGPQDWFSADVVAADAAKNLAILRAKDVHLPPSSFANSKDVALGQTIFSLSMSREGQWHVERGIVSQIANGETPPQFSFSSTQPVRTGEGIFTYDGKLLGMGIALEKEEIFVSSQVLQDFMQQVLSGM